MSSEPFVVAGKAPNPVIARMWADALRDEGIVALVPGEFLSDQVAFFQQATGMLACEVTVAAADLDRAREVLEGMTPGADMIDFGEFDDTLDLPESDGGRPPGGIESVF